MAELAEKQAVAVLSPDKDFGETLAEQVAHELSLACKVFSSKDELCQYLDIATKAPLALVTPESLEDHWPFPVIVVKQPPVKLSDVLRNIAGIAQNHRHEDIRLGQGYLLQWRLKQLSHTASGKSVSLTDKEAQLLLQLAEAGGEVVAKEHLLKTIWGFDEALDTHTLETHIYRLRGKFRELADTDTMITAMEGGYRLDL